MVNYSVRQKVNPRDIEEARKYYAIAKSSRTVDVREIAEQIAEEVSLGTSDVLGVLESLLKNIPKNLSRGHIVKLRDFGTYRLTVQSEGSATEEEFHDSMIKGTKVQFRPDPLFLRSFALLKYQKVQ
ncbi:HU family DNA-binding protein [Lentimicrobium sp. S6]|uniref:HU family DNA-binding protein n=1 Tax=Lentimicrobium sp. S6 TaxID=2735872 RepID=UPI001553C777|nr:HU family DNA-binding protein [Lentimicrobium sp. S6]NPD48099.1 DNA-binding protein [Lentimicrobium sp. S6]